MPSNISHSTSVLGPVFRALPGVYLILNHDLTILDATDAYLQATMVTREAITGKYFFDVFPNNPATPTLDSAGEFEHSLRFVLQEQKPHTMPVLRYDLPVAEGNSNAFETRYWSPTNSPIFDAEGKLIYLLHEARDITEKVLTEEAREHHTERLHLLTSALNAVAWEYDMVNNRLTWGQGLFEVFGYTPEEMGPGGESWDSRVHPDDFKALQSSIYEATSTGKKIWTGEYRFRKANGDYAHVLDQGYIIYNCQGQPTRTIGSIIDLSRSKRVEEDLKESDSRFRHLLENLPHMAWTADPKGKVLYFNDNWYSYTGMQKGQTEGWVNVIHPEDTADVLTAWYEAINTGNLYEIEYRIRDFMDGTYRTFLERGVPMYDPNGNVKLWIGTYTDIEEQKQILEKIRFKDQQLENILKLSPAHMCLLEGPNHVCRYVSPGVYRIYGSRGYIGKTAAELWPEFKESGFIALLNQVYHKGEIVQIDEYSTLYDRHQHGNSEKVYFDIKYQPILDNSGDIEGVLISAVEVTEAVKAKREAAEMALRLQKIIS
ncbi:PAS domain-containing protein [Pontibacter sp. MBLB2868]|uniref:PAS domain-containing protein n=1 Tax=Pontibacter sp. MBLB2868 TaxID=3451555 RepID=UPI003F74CBE1